MRPEIAQAHRESRIYIHDLSDYDIGDHNCFARNTSFITDRGTKTFLDFNDGDTVTVLTHAGNWKKATVRCAGVQNVNLVEFRRGPKGFPFYVTVTPNHRWILHDGTVSDHLAVGDILIDAPDVFCFDFESASMSEKEYWCKGFAVWCVYLYAKDESHAEKKAHDMIAEYEAKKGKYMLIQEVRYE